MIIAKGGTTMKRRNLIQYGYKAFNGHTFNDYSVDSYNLIQNEINRFIDAGMKVSEEMLNRSHFMFCMGAGIYGKG